MTKKTQAILKDPLKLESGPAKDRQFVTALARGLAVLRALGDTDSLSPADIARRTGLAQATVWRICRTLVELGYLTRIEDSDNLRVGPPVLRLGRTMLSNLRVLKIARPHMERLQAESEGAITLASRSGTTMLCLDRLEGRAVFSSTTHAGRPISLYKGSVGWAHMAGLPGDQRALLFAALDERGDPDWLDMRENVLAAVKACAACGYVTSKGTLHAAINAVAVPIRDAGRQEVFSMSCGGLASVFDDDALARIGPMLAEAGRSIEAELNAA